MESLGKGKERNQSSLEGQGKQRNKKIKGSSPLQTNAGHVLWPTSSTYSVFSLSSVLLGEKLPVLRSEYQ